ncbi:hypothetical protein COV94_01450 [Candidatus Woesearchaeota archaeon CG11_big_fil_rev_8_21_14_0_20_57_5]|nr:MAG: hypothetical protein COV94_01450 [Candidatus Woesearchaeota archaeon CG11_big_fil_rev_8_21_14_0_20_57_5]
MPMKALVAEPIHNAAIQALKGLGLSVEVSLGLSRDALCSALGSGAIDVLIIRTKVQADRELLNCWKGTQRLLCRAGIGVDNIDLDAATALGIAVINTAEASTQSVAELAIGLMIAAARNVASQDRAIRIGAWKRQEGMELSGKTLGIIGLGRIGSRVAMLGKALGMHVVAHDPYIRDDRFAEFGAEKSTLEDTLGRADVVSLHTPLTPETERMMNKARLGIMKQGSILINTARGPMVDDEALCDALDSGHLAGAALDVFPEEPYKGRLLSNESVIMTPHIGGSTSESLERIGMRLVEQIAEFLRAGHTSALNAPLVPTGAEDLVVLARALGRLCAQLDGPLHRITVQASAHGRVLTHAAVQGALSVHQEGINLVNALAQAQQRGISVLTGQTEPADKQQPGELQVMVNETLAAGSVQGGMRITRIGEHTRLDFAPQGSILLLWYDDVPGVIGAVGTHLGKADINIKRMVVSDVADGNALMALAVGDALDAEVMEGLRERLKEFGLSRLAQVRL